MSREDELQSMSRDELIALLNQETRANSAWTIFFHTAVAESLGLHTTDHKCLDMIWQSESLGEGAYLTPGRLAQLTQLTTGAITGILDRLEQAGYVRREHDPEDRRRVIIRPIAEKVKTDLRPVFDSLMRSFGEMCSKYSEDELRLMIGFARESQALLQRAVEQVRGANAARQQGAN